MCRARHARAHPASALRPSPAPAPVSPSRCPPASCEDVAVPFDHERLDVHQLALDLLVLVNDTIEHLPRGRSHLADQLGRAATSIVLNIASRPWALRPSPRRSTMFSCV